MDLNGKNLNVSGNTEIREVINNTRKLKPGLLIIDSIQTLFSSSLTSLPGSIQQIRECSAILQQLAKKEGFTTLMIGHVTKDGEIAGPKILEHTVDRSEEHTSELQSRGHLVCRLLLEKK